jgi:hypothetical protein
MAYGQWLVTFSLMVRAMRLVRVGAASIGASMHARAATNVITDA